MLARIPSTRSTNDIDLYRAGYSLDQALADLRRLAELDLGDYFRFIYRDHRESMTGDRQPYVDAYRVTFDVYIGAQNKGRINIDLATGAGLTAPVTTAEPANRLFLPRLLSHPYRLYPLVDQIADKVCAIMERHNGQASSREKDLVDLTVIALTQRVEGHALAQAIRTEARRRRMPTLVTFEIPSVWGRGYTRLARQIPHLVDHTDITVAAQLVATLVGPTMSRSLSVSTWNPETLTWD